MFRVILLVLSLVMVSCGGGQVVLPGGDAGMDADVMQVDAGVDSSAPMCEMPDAGVCETCEVCEDCPECPEEPMPCECQVGVQVVRLTDQRWVCPTIECTGHCDLTTLVLESVDVCYCID